MNFIKIYYILFVVLSFFSFQIHAQNNDSSSTSEQWFIDEYPYDDDILFQNVTMLLKKSFIPIGMHITEEKNPRVQIIYSKNTPFSETTTWVLKVFDNPKNITADLNIFLTNNWIPMAMSLNNYGLTVLFIKNTAYHIEGWSLEQIPNNSTIANDMKNTMNTLYNTGMIPQAISYYNHTMWILSVKYTPTPLLQFNVFKIINDGQEIFYTIPQYITQKNYPWGFTLYNDFLIVPFATIKNKV